MVDTGGWQQGNDADLIEDICIQAEMAVAAADLILFVVDAQGGITSDDAAIARLLRPETDRVVMVANKADNDTCLGRRRPSTGWAWANPCPYRPSMATEWPTCWTCWSSAYHTP